jgi:hypothetical protein
LGFPGRVLAERLRITKPSRSASNGRLAASGSSLRRESARIAEKPETPTLVIAASLPPQSITSARPSRIASSPAPIAICDTAQAVHSDKRGPLRAKLDRDPTGAHVRNDLRDRKRANPIGPPADQRVVAILERLQTTHRARDRSTNPVRLPLDSEPRIRLGLTRRRHNHLREAIHPPRPRVVNPPLINPPTASSA